MNPEKFARLLPEAGAEILTWQPLRRRDPSNTRVLAMVVI